MKATHECLTAMREFLLTMPFAAPYEDLDTIDYGEVAAGSGEGSAIALAGDQTVSRKRSVTGRETHRKRTNFILILWREANDNEFRRDIANSLIRTIGWINEEDAKRGTPDANPALPRFSMTGYEALSADGGVKTVMLDKTRAEFQIQIHADYEITY